LLPLWPLDAGDAPLEPGFVRIIVQAFADDADSAGFVVDASVDDLPAADEGRQYGLSLATEQKTGISKCMAEMEPPTVFFRPIPVITMSFADVVVATLPLGTGGYE
jgi:hypothetical protein